jgi:hypothetical protein
MYEEVLKNLDENIIKEFSSYIPKTRGKGGKTLKRMKKNKITKKRRN